MSDLKNITITVPATTGNVGPGFDTLGMAVGIFNTVKVSFNSKNLRIKNNGVDKEKYQGIALKDNLIIEGIKSISPEFNINQLSIESNNMIPLGGGLGSSAAALCTGLLIGNYIQRENCSIDQLNQKAIELEGHPDNTTPCFFGGLTISIYEKQSKKWVSQKIEIPKDLNILVYVPNFSSNTNKSRKNLPNSIPRKDAIYNIGRAGLLINCFINNNFEMLKLATQDSLHQETRLKEFPEIKSIMQAALSGGALGSILSGSGPSIMVFSKGNEFTINYEIEEAARKHNLEGNIILTKPHNQGILIK